MYFVTTDTNVSPVVYAMSVFESMTKSEDFANTLVEKSRKRDIILRIYMDSFFIVLVWAI